MVDKKKQKNGLWKKLRAHYRLVIMNDDTFEEKFSLRLNRLNVFAGLSLLSAVMIAITISVVAFTPLREYIPGYGTEIATRRQLIHLALKTDSLHYEVSLREMALQNLKNILSGNVPLDSVSAHDFVKSAVKEPVQINYDVALKPSRKDSAFRAEMESRDKYSLSFSPAKAADPVSGVFFFTPLKGVLTASFNAREKHFGIDIAARENEPVKAALDGTVIFSGWTTETGNTIHLQHNGNMVSVYAHCSALLKKTGQYVKAGEAIAITGNSGTHTTGPHLHFELWFNGRALDPQEYMAF